MLKRVFNSASVRPSRDGVILTIYLNREGIDGSWIEFQTFGQSMAVLGLFARAIWRRYVLRERPDIKPALKAYRSSRMIMRDALQRIAIEGALGNGPSSLAAIADAALTAIEAKP